MISFFSSYRYMVESVSDGPLTSMALKSFILNVGARSPAPGGGSVAAAIGAMVIKELGFAKLALCL